MYLNGKPLGFIPFQINNHSPRLEQALAYAHTLCKLESSPTTRTHYTYSRINGRETIRIYTKPSEPRYIPSRVIGKC